LSTTIGWCRSCAIASATTYWQDPMSNYYSFGIAYNAGFWNRGSWANFIPGFSYPGMERFPEAPLWVGTTYVWFNVLFPVAFAAVWLRLDRRFPRTLDLANQVRDRIDASFTIRQWRNCSQFPFCP